MDGFVAALRQRNQDGAFAMGYYDDSELPFYWNIADEFVLFDRFFQSAAGGSVLNHMFWVTGTAASSETGGIPLDGYGELRTIFDRLEEKGISWKFYVQNYDPLITYRSGRTEGPKAAQVVRVPLLNYARYIDDPELFSHIVPLDEYYEDAANGTLPAVSYMVPSGNSEQPPGSIQSGQTFVRGLISELTRSDAWHSSAFMWTYDDWGGWYDHVVPPQVDAHGYGFRVPALLVSPYAKRGYVDSTQLDFTSMLKFIEENWGLEPLAQRDASANSIEDAFDFSQTPREPHFVSASRVQETPLKSGGLVVYIAYGFAAMLAGSVIALAVFQPARVVRSLVALRPRRHRGSGR
jgi:phospholipase C